MKIANPIYDVVFKYLMEDLSVAKLILETLLDKEIIELDFLPTEMIIKTNDLEKLQTADYTYEKKENTLKSITGLAVYRIDFAAKIRDKNGNETQIIIELQKARLFNNIRRFRNYLGKQYTNPNLLVTLCTLNEVSYDAGIPIYAIYFLGYTLDKYPDIPILSIESLVLDHFTKKVLDKSEPFVSSLFHEGMIISIPALKGEGRDNVEKMLSIFEHSLSPNLYVLDINNQIYPKSFFPIIYRLQAAAADYLLQEQIRAEDEVMQDLEMLEEQLQAAKTKVKEEQTKFLVEQAKVKEERKKTEEAEQKVLEERKRVENMIIEMAELGAPIEKIARMCLLSVHEVEAILKK